MWLLFLCFIVVEAQTAVTVPLALASVAQADPETFGRYLARARVPAGIEARTADSRWERLIDLPGDPQAVMNLEDLAAAFNRQHENYQARVSEGVLLIQPATGTAKYLDSLAADPRVIAQGLSAALRRLFLPLNANLGKVSVVSQLGPPEGKFDAGDGIAIDINTTGRTVRQALVDLARLGRGHVWVVRTTVNETPRIAEVGLFHYDGGLTRLAVEVRGPR